MKDVQRPKHDHSPYNDSGTTWGRPQGGKTAGVRKGPVTPGTKSSPKSAGTGARQAVGGTVNTAVKVVKGLV